MAPPCRVFQAADLPHEIQFNQGKRRKPALVQVAQEGDGGSGFGSSSESGATTATTTIRAKKVRQGSKIDLSACELFSMTQYDCQIDRPEVGDSPVRCWPVQRWFRRCQDRKGSFMVETTKWEGTTQDISSPEQQEGNAQTRTPQTPTQPLA